jgi:tetratricopeptide (TPR) repeat protein
MLKYGLAGGLLTLLLLAAGGIYRWSRPTIPEPPGVERSELEPQVWSAIEDARTAVRQAPRSAQSWGKLGMVYLAHNYLPEAIACLDQAGQLDAKDARLPYYLGIALTPGDPQAAIRPLERAVELSGGQPDAVRLRLAKTLFAMGRSEEARQQFEQILRHNASHATAHLGLARIAVEAEDSSACRAHLRSCSNHPTTRKATQQLLAALDRRAGDAKSADRHLRQAERLPEDAEWSDPWDDELAALRKDRVARIRHCQVLMRQERLDEAIAGLNQLVQEDPDWDLGWQTLGAALTQQRRYVAAEQALHRALALSPNSVEALFFLGNAALFQGEYPKAAAAYRKAIQLKPDHALSHDNLARCLALQGDRAGAIEAFRNALRIKPYLADSHRLLASLLIQEGKRAEARNHLLLALDLDPEDARSKKLLDQIQVQGSGPAPSSPSRSPPPK